MVENRRGILKNISLYLSHYFFGSWKEVLKSNTEINIRPDSLGLVAVHGRNLKRAQGKIISEPYGVATKKFHAFAKIIWAEIFNQPICFGHDV